MATRDTTNQIRIEGVLSPALNTTTGRQQEEEMSPIVLNLAFEYTIICSGEKTLCYKNNRRLRHMRTMWRYRIEISNSGKDVPATGREYMQNWANC